MRQILSELDIVFSRNFFMLHFVLRFSFSVVALVGESVEKDVRSNRATNCTKVDHLFRLTLVQSSSHNHLIFNEPLREKIIFVLLIKVLIFPSSERFCMSTGSNKTALLLSKKRSISVFWSFLFVSVSFVYVFPRKLTEFEGKSYGPSQLMR